MYRESPYEDIIGLPHHVSKTHPQMDIKNRAAQFAPFAALTGYDDAVAETARLTERKVELDENSKEILDRKLQWIEEHSAEHPQITVTYFKPDEKKTGGEYLVETGNVSKIDHYEQVIVLLGNTRIAISNISDMNWA